MADSQHDVIVIGCGMAGLAAARSAVEAGLQVAAMESLLPGGLVVNVNQLDGAVAGSGAELAATMLDEAMNIGVEHLGAQALHIGRDGEGLLVTSDSGSHAARAVIVATGARLKALGVPGETEFENRGVSHCADCDGPMLTGKTAVVVGGGDSALQSAAILARHCARVHLLHRGSALAGQEHLAQAVTGMANVTLHWRSVVESLRGADALETVCVRQLDSGRAVELAADAFFAFVGLEPAVDCVPSDAARDVRGALLVDDAHRTSCAGIYAAGVVRSGCGGNVQDAIDDGQAAAASVARALGVAV